MFPPPLSRTLGQFYFCLLILLCEPVEKAEFWECKKGWRITEMRVVLAFPCLMFTMTVRHRMFFGFWSEATKNLACPCWRLRRGLRNTGSDDLMLSVWCCRCTYNSTSKDQDTHIGPSSGDEMCNLYIMFFTEPGKARSTLQSSVRMLLVPCHLSHAEIPVNFKDLFGQNEEFI